ncbi:helix-turn-helix domain-containing protein, partial [Salmonella enterica]|uniref:helix-turn-helix domain-containing protein n=1 Tax=Salmonella enterica TaxID=28901 RepID=UPI000930EF4E
MRYAHRFVKSKRISITCKMHTMAFDDRPDQAKRLEKARVNRGFRTAKEAARFFGWTYETYTQQEQGIRGSSRAAGRYAEAFRVGEGWLLTGEGTGGPPPKISGERAVK